MKHAKPLSTRSRPSVARETSAPYGSEPAESQDIPAGEFKARCLALMNEVQERGREYVITKRGVPVARLVPVRVERKTLRGSMRGTVKTIGDIVSPLNEPWEALDDDDEF